MWPALCVVPAVGFEVGNVLLPVEHGPQHHEREVGALHTGEVQQEVLGEGLGAQRWAAERVLTEQ